MWFADWSERLLHLVCAAGCLALLESDLVVSIGAVCWIQNPALLHSSVVELAPVPVLATAGRC